VTVFDPRHPIFKNRLGAGSCLGVAWLALGSAALAELAARSRPDALVLDQQHGLWERRELEAAIGLVPSEIPVLVRVAENSALAIGTALDAGAEGVIVPLIESAQAAAQAVRSSRYPPRGARSGGGVRPLQDFPGYLAGADAIATILMIETRAGLEQAEAIAATEGVDMIFIGTGDLALSIGAAASQPEHTEACAQIRRASEAAGVPCGIFTGSVEGARLRRDEGYSMVVVATDIDLAARGFAAGAQGFRGAHGSGAR
jgi:2-keto-3-deoxy-L-rhamnonate aldolase RhmA